ncbi:MAG TPA: nitroreductase family protein [Candidatus Ozemobacteraceae bacterium]|nr:nitroreductase family protein [Candidatus Ozemobacteraceae bacterium]
MDFFALAAKRRTVRQFAADPVPREQIEKIIQAGLMAPSPNNSQPWKVAVIADRKMLEAMKSAVEKKLDTLFPKVSAEAQTRLDKVRAFSTMFTAAPVVLAILSKPYKAMIDKVLEESSVTHDQMNTLRRHPDIQSVGAMVENMLLAATELGLGGCWVSGALVASDAIDALLKEKEYRIQTLVALGKPAAKPAVKEPLPLADYVSWIG